MGRRVTLPRKGARRYKKTTVSGITLKTYIPNKNHKKLPEVCYTYTKDELKQFAEQRGMKVYEKKTNKN